MKTCPKCGGKNGFAYNLILKESMFGDWGEDNDESGDTQRYRTPKTVTCFDCGKRIDFDVAHGAEE